MQRLDFSGAVRPIYGSLGVKRLISPHTSVHTIWWFCQEVHFLVSVIFLWPFGSVINARF